MKATLSLKIIQEKVKTCKKCDLCDTSRIFKVRLSSNASKIVGLFDSIFQDSEGKSRYCVVWTIPMIHVLDYNT